MWVHRALFAALKTRVHVECPASTRAEIAACPRVVFANLNQLSHLGNLGVVLALDEIAQHRPVPFVTNWEWFLVPVVGWLAPPSLVIVRQWPSQARSVMTRLAHRLKNELVQRVYISVEGARRVDASVQLPFKKGAAHLALQGNAVIVPVIMGRSCCDSVLPRAWWWWKRRRIISYRFLAPLQTRGKTAGQICDELRALDHEF